MIRFHRCCTPTNVHESSKIVPGNINATIAMSSYDTLVPVNESDLTRIYNPEARQGSIYQSISY